MAATPESILDVCSGALPPVSIIAAARSPRKIHLTERASSTHYFPPEPAHIVCSAPYFQRNVVLTDRASTEWTPPFVRYQLLLSNKEAITQW